MSTIGADTSQQMSSAARAFVLVVLTAGASALAILAGRYVHGLHVGLAADYRPAAGRALVATTDVVTMRWRADDVARATAAGRICVGVPGHGRICAGFARGQRPAVALTRALEREGLRVETS